MCERTTSSFRKVGARRRERLRAGGFRLHSLTMSREISTAGRGLLLVISGPSGVGKTTIVREVERRLGGSFSVSATTRPKSPTEVDGRDYYFMTEEQFNEKLSRGEFLEHACVFGRHFYGTPREPVERQLRAGELVILDIDVQGAQQVKRAMPDAYTLFVLPPSEDVLLQRLRGRARDDEQTIQRRFAEARDETAFAKESGCYDELIVNDELEEAVETIVRLTRARLASPQMHTGKRG